jgi:xanthine dehydrogenase accessory factor
VRDVLPEIERWREKGGRVALATVVATWGSAPRTVGSRMAVSADGSTSGSVSGGCVEGAVVEAAAEVLSRGTARLLRFGVSDDTAWSVGLACGGTIEVFVEPLDDDFFLAARDALNDERPVAIAEILGGSGLGRRGVVPVDGPVSGSLDAASLEVARVALAEGRGRRVPLPDGELFVDVLLPSPRLIVVGGVHIAVALVPLARQMGFRTVVVDPRQRFGAPERFPEADEIVSEWPEPALARLRLNAGTAVAALAHDPKLDDPALIAALASPAFYVGALGSTRTQEKRRARLLSAGVSEEALRRLHAPIGLDLGGRSPEEIALSIMAEVVAVRHGRTGAG